MSRNKIIVALASLSLALIVVWMVLPPKRDVRYTITDLGALGGKSSFPFSINNKGHVAGVSKTLAGLHCAFLWSGEEGMQNIGSFFPHAMNERDEIVGELLTNNHACLWTPTDGLIDLGTLGGTSSIANGINNRGEVVGTSTRSEGRECGFIWNATEGMRPLDREWLAYDINDAGEILCSTRSNRSEAFVYSRDRDAVIPFEDRTSSLEFPSSQAEYSNSSLGGLVYCCLPRCDVESRFPIPVEKGYWVSVFDSNGIQTVGSVHYENPHLKAASSKRGFPNSIVNLLVWVTERLADSRAVLWEGEEAIELTYAIPSDSGWKRLESAMAVNESGQIVGVGTIGGNRRAFLLNPIRQTGEEATESP